MSSYRFYPTLLDKFQSLLDYEQEAEQPWNIVSESAKSKGKYPDKEVGDYILTPDEIALQLEVELIDTVNRCEYGGPMPAADRGSCLNEIVDCMVMNLKSTRDDIVIERIKDYEGGNTIGLKATMNGADYNFDAQLCRTLAKYFKGSVCQYQATGTIDTKYGEVALYGYIDYWQRDRVLDLKTTSYYQFGKYEQKWQRYIYPYCLTQEGYEISEMEFSVVQLTKVGELIGGLFYPEVYSYRHDVATEAIRQMCERFIEWLESVSPAIHQRRIFGDLADTSIGVPIAVHDLFRDEHLDALRRYAFKNGYYETIKD